MSNRVTQHAQYITSFADNHPKIYTCMIGVGKACSAGVDKVKNLIDRLGGFTKIAAVLLIITGSVLCCVYGVGALAGAPLISKGVAYLGVGLGGTGIIMAIYKHCKNKKRQEKEGSEEESGFRASRTN